LRCGPTRQGARRQGWWRRQHLRRSECLGRLRRLWLKRRHAEEIVEEAAAETAAREEMDRDLAR
jgi:hypothetical protein